jgi:2-polyprenyl-3-methyl-5-hydroxy-6-metoxy-1,4-benzoquinol methylase
VSFRCLTCGGCSPRLLYALADDGHARIVVCRTCDLVQLEKLPTPEELDDLYARGYFEGRGDESGYAEYGEQEEEYLATFGQDVLRIKTLMSEGSVLDVGCGYGYFLRSAQAAGFDAYGVDRSPEGVREAEKHAPGRVFEGTIESVTALADQQFDVIFASHLIEHILEPRSFLLQMVRHLTEDGILVLVTPNIKSWLARISGRRWVSFKIPEHVAYYDPKTMRHLLEGVGLEVLAIDPAHQYYRLPFLMRRVRELIDPFGRLVPRFESWPGFRDRMLRVSSGSMRVIACRPGRMPGRSI